MCTHKVMNTDKFIFHVNTLKYHGTQGKGNFPQCIFATKILTHAEEKYLKMAGN